MTKIGLPNIISTNMVVLMWIVIVACCASILFAASPSELIISRQAIQTQLAALQKQLADVRLAKYTLSGLKEATGVITSNQISISGVTSFDVDSLGSEVSDQYSELERHERSILLKMAIVQRSLEVLAVNITMSGYNPLLKRMAMNFFGTTFIAPNGTLYYFGQVNNYFVNGRAGYSTTYTQTYPTAVDVSPLEGATVTQVYAGRTYFYAVTSKGDIWHWGGTDSTIGAPCACGGSYGSSYVLRKLDFGLIGKQVIPKKIICDQSLDTKYNTYPTLACFMLSMDGEIYFMGAWVWEYAYNMWGPRPTYSSNKVRKLKIQIGGVEKFASDLAISQSNINAYFNPPEVLRNGATICVIDRDNATNIYCTGDNNGGQFGDGSIATTNVPYSLDIAASSWVLAKKQASSDGEIFTQIHGAKQTLYAIGATGKVHTWGSSGILLARGATESNTKIGRATFSSYFSTSKICTSPATDVILLVSATSNEVYVLGTVNGENFDSPYQPPAFKGKQFVDCEVNEQGLLVLFSNGQVYAKGKNDFAQLMVGYTSAPILPFVESFIPVYYQ